MIKILLLLLVSVGTLARGAGVVVVDKKWYEDDYVKHHCKGSVEHYLTASKSWVDCLTDTHAIEYDYGHKWQSAIGQSLHYSAVTGKKAGIVLIVNQRTKERYLDRLEMTIKAHNLDIEVWTIEKH